MWWHWLEGAKELAKEVKDGGFQQTAHPTLISVFKSRHCWKREAIIFVPDNCFPFNRRTLVSSSLQVGSVSDICRCASRRGENSSALAPKAADGGRFEWFASVIVWPPVRKGIGETCSELSFYVNVWVLPCRLEHCDVIMQKASGGKLACSCSESKHCF